MTLRDRIPLQKRKIIKKGLWGTLGIILLWIIASFVLFHLMPIEGGGALGGWSLPSLWRMWAGVLAFALLWKLAYPILYFITYHYDMDDKNVVIRKGVIAKKEITLPFAKITDVYVEQDTLDVILALYDVHISTPTVQSGTFAHIDGLNREGAAELRRVILEKIGRTSSTS